MGERQAYPIGSRRTRGFGARWTIVVAVAVAYLGLALSSGGYFPEALAVGAVAVWWVVIIGLMLGFLPRAPIATPALAAAAALAGLALWTALSLGWAADNGRAFVETVRVAGYLGLFVLVLVASPRGSARSWLVGLAIGSLALALIALGSRLEPFLPGSDAEIGRSIASAQGRLSYPIGYWNALAACMAAGVVGLAWLGARAASRLGRTLAVAALPVPILVIYLTSSRGGAVAAAIGLALLVALGPARPLLLGGIAIGGAGAALLIVLADRRPDLVNDLGTEAAARQGDGMLLAVLAVVAAAAAARHLADPLLQRLRVSRPAVAWGLGILAVAVAVVLVNPVQRFEDFSRPPQADTAAGGGGAHFTQVSSSGRYQFWETALDAFASDPLKGVGAGGFDAWWNQHGSIARSVSDAHSLFLESLAELGLPGLLLVVGFLAAAAYAGIARPDPGGGERGAALALIAAGIVSAAVDWMWEVPAAFVPVVVAAGVLAGPALLRARPRLVSVGSDDDEPASPSRSRFGWGIAALVAGWATLWAAGVLFLSELKLDDSREAVNRGDLEAAARAAADARTLQPWASEPRLQLALVDELAGDLPSARDALAGAIDRSPDDWRLWLIAARLDVAAGDVEAASEALRRARELNPREPLLERAPRIPRRS